MQPSSKRRDEQPREIPDERARFSHLLHTMVLRFGAISDEVREDNAKLREEWRKARGVAAWTEERLGVIELSLVHVRSHLALPEPPEVAQLRAILANYPAEWRPNHRGGTA